MNIYLKSILLSLLLISGLLCGSAFAGQTALAPNIILIVADDLGWRDTGFMGNRFIETPTLDKLAEQGAVFSQAYANAPNCAPSRAAIMTGLYAPRTGMYTMIRGDMGKKPFQKKLTPPNKMYLEPPFTTLAEALKQQGYETIHIGKWNLGTGPVRGPEGQGFDINIGGYRGGVDSYFAPYGKAVPGLQDAPQGEYLTERLSREAVNVIERHGSGKNTRPFFIYLPFFAPHYPIEAPADTVAKYEHKKTRPEFADINIFPPYAAMIDELDRGIQRIVTALQQQGLAENTIIVFTSDNGANARDTDMGYLRGGKSSLHEGGIRVPLLFWWPGQISLQRSDVPMMGIDLFPTLMTLAGQSDKPSSLQLDGIDVSELLKNPQASVPTRNLYWYFPAYTTENPHTGKDFFVQRPALAMRQGQWKLIRDLEGDQHQLYNLAEDPAEQHNLASQKPEKLAEMVAEVDAWAAQMQAPLPLADNPDYRQPSVLDRWLFHIENWFK